MIANLNKFSVSQMTSNINGKTSGSGTIGILVCTIGTICFLLGAIDKAFITHTIDIMTQSIIFVGIGAALLGYRKSKGSSVVKNATTHVTTDTSVNSNTLTDETNIQLNS